MERLNVCCTPQMLGEVRAHLSFAIPTVESALGKLSSPAAVSSALWDNFRVRPDDDRVLQIRSVLRSMLEAMQGNRVTFVCRSSDEDPMCAGIRAETVPTCTSSGSIYVHFCGNYQASAQRGQPYLVGENWLKTLVHEYAHVGCTATGPIFPSGREFYKGRDQYPQDSDKNIRNADCYAWFTIDAS